jgi:hypothetical protein
MLYLGLSIVHASSLGSEFFWIFTTRQVNYTTLSFQIYRYQLRWMRYPKPCKWLSKLVSQDPGYLINSHHQVVVFHHSAFRHPFIWKGLVTIRVYPVSIGVYLV